MLKIKLNTLVFRGFFFLFIFTIVSRGLFELFLDKKIAFLIQVVSIIIFIFFSLFTFKIRISTKYFYAQTIFFSVFVFSAIVSIMITKYFNHGGAPIFYSLIMMFLAFTLIFISSFNISRFGVLDFGGIFIIIIIVLFAVSLYEQLTNTLMPGAWWLFGEKVRPASLTGSKQHYSIIMALLSLLTFQYWLSLKRKKYLYGAILGFVAVFLSLSRSGAMVLVLAFFPFIYYYLYSLHIIKLSSKLFIILFFGLVSALIVPFLFVDFEFFFERVISAVDIKSAGNGARIKHWINGINLISNSHVFIFGEYTGVVTNATRTLTKTKSFVVESGVLQMILNFGFIGFISFYLIILNIYTRIKREHIFLLFTLFSGLISTIVYQSIETIPFIVLVSFIPLVSSDIKQMSKEVGNNRHN